MIATRSTLTVPDIEGIDEIDYWTSADVLDATELPDSGVVMGFGYVGLELVPYLAEAETDLTVIEHDERPLDEADPAYGDEILDLYREEFDAEGGTVLGYQGLHYHADAMAKTMQVVVELELDVREVPDRAFHPTTPEIIDWLLHEASEQLE